MGRLKEKLMGKFVTKEHEYQDIHFDDSYHYNEYRKKLGLKPITRKYVNSIQKTKPGRRTSI